jgi:hypothetical protein
MATIADIFHYRDITLMTDEEANRETALWPSAENIVSLFPQGYPWLLTLRADDFEL